MVASAAMAAAASAEVVPRLLGAKGARTAHENMLEVFSYAISFSAFYVFVWVAMRMTREPSFRREASSWTRLVHSCAIGDDQGEYVKEDAGRAKDAPPAETFWKNAMRLAVCAVGIQVSYLLWGLMQERIMTKPYESGHLFRSSKFLVFANRFLALIAAWVGLKLSGETPEGAAKSTPLYKFSFSSVSNIMSSVCQYEALKFVSFPTQVLAKSCKMVPVMVMGYFVNKKLYSAFEYAVALSVTAGAAVFKLYETNDAPVKNTEVVGIVLIVAYMVCDSFTSNWQSAVFKEYEVSSLGMMM
jgi:adenosine 3'-phospho 5'-phosphosulfate transporter B2